MKTGKEFVFAAIDSVNQMSDDGEVIKKAPETPLLGNSASVDSLVLVNLVVAIEEAIMDDTGKVVTLITEDSMTQESSPFDSVQSLADYVDKRLS